MENSNKVEVKHTPGPWIVEDKGLNDHGVQVFSIDQHEDAEVRPNAYRACSMAEVYADEFNAKLIAAAPELLGALQGLTRYFEWALTDPTFHEFVKAKEAIKKATS